MISTVLHASLMPLIHIVGTRYRNDIDGMRFPLNGFFCEMLIKFESKLELPQFWIEKTYLAWMIVDIVQHQNKLYHIKGPWEGNHKHTNSAADETDRIISSVTSGNQIIVSSEGAPIVMISWDLSGDLRFWAFMPIYKDFLFDWQWH